MILNKFSIFVIIFVLSEDMVSKLGLSRYVLIVLIIIDDMVSKLVLSRYGV